MPDVNLLRDTKQPEQPKPSKTPSGFDVTDPAAQDKPGLGGFFRNMFAGRSAGQPPTPATPSAPSRGKMSLQKSTGQERVLSENRSAARPAVIPLPEDEGAFNVNLLSEELISTFNPRQKMIQLGLFALGAILILGGAYAALRVYRSTVAKQVTADQQSIAKVETDITSLSQQQQAVVVTTKKLGAVKALIDRHVRWSRFFHQLEHYTLPTVSFGPSFAANIGGAMSFSATTTSYENVAKQYLVLQQAIKNQDFISEFTITGASESKTPSGDRVNFTLSFTILPSLLENPPVAATTANPATTDQGTSPSLNTNSALAPTP